MRIAGIVIIVQFIIFKLLYPFADFFSDSYSYIYAAQENLNINIWPIGYSKFLRLFHFITDSDTALVGFQYFFLELSALYFLFTIQYFYSPINKINLIVFIFIIFNPLFLYLSNYINSDSLFASLSLIWFTQLIWIIQAPRFRYIFSQTLILFLCFTIRNNAYYYPFVSSLAFVLSTQGVWTKLAGIILPGALLVCFIIYTRNEAYKVTGTRQFSLFTGWILANNALYIRDQIKDDRVQFSSEKAKELDSLSKSFFAKVGPDYRYFLSSYVGNYFIRERKSPLKQYAYLHYKITDKNSALKTWGKISPLYAEYGSTIVKNNLFEYFRYFILPNSKNYILPPLEKLEQYNQGGSYVEQIAVDWFNYRSVNVNCVSNTLQYLLLLLFPPLFLLINIYFITATCYSLLLRKLHFKNALFKNIQILIFVFFILNASFSILVTINVLRYQFFPMIIIFTFSLLLMESVLKNKINTGLKANGIGSISLIKKYYKS